jgi:hypothetical protein
MNALWKLSKSRPLMLLNSAKGVGWARKSMWMSLARPFSSEDTIYDKMNQRGDYLTFLYLKEYPKDIHTILQTAEPKENDLEFKILSENLQILAGYHKKLYEKESSKFFDGELIENLTEEKREEVKRLMNSVLMSLINQVEMLPASNRIKALDYLYDSGIRSDQLWHTCFDSLFTDLANVADSDIEPLVELLVRIRENYGLIKDNPSKKFRRKLIFDEGRYLQIVDDKRMLKLIKRAERIVSEEGFQVLNKPKFLCSFYEIGASLEMLSIWDYTALNKFSNLIQERLVGYEDILGSKTMTELVAINEMACHMIQFGIDSPLVIGLMEKTTYMTFKSRDPYKNKYFDRLLTAYATLGSMNQEVWKTCMRESIVHSYIGQKRSQELFKLSFKMACSQLKDDNLWSSLIYSASRIDFEHIFYFFKRHLHLALEGGFASKLIPKSSLEMATTLHNQLSAFCVCDRNEIDQTSLIQKLSERVDCCDPAFIKAVLEANQIQGQFRNRERKSGALILKIRDAFKDHYKEFLGDDEDYSILEDFKACQYMWDLALFSAKSNRKIGIELSVTRVRTTQGKLLGKKKLKKTIMNEKGWVCVISDIFDREMSEALASNNPKNVARLLCYRVKQSSEKSSKLTN